MSLNFLPYYDTEEKSITVLLPTRGRTTSLQKSVQTLFDTASNPSDIELMLAFDNDDTETQEWFRDNVVPSLVDKQVSVKIMTFERLGYGRLNEYLNSLARYAQGKWFFFWNDDAWMETQGWDDEILKYNGQFRILRMPTHNEHPYAIFPIVPREWYRLLGYLSPHQINDAWISQTGYILNIVQNIPVKCHHDRFDLTGNNADDTYYEGGPKGLKEGNPGDPEDFHHINWVRRRHEDADRVAWYLSSLGEDMSWYQNVMKGKQDPFEYMCSKEQDPNKQLARKNHAD